VRGGVLAGDWCVWRGVAAGGAGVVALWVVQGEVAGDGGGDCGDGAGEYAERSAYSGFECSFVAEAGVRVLDLVASAVAALPRGRAVGDVLVVGELVAVEGRGRGRQPARGPGDVLVVGELVAVEGGEAVAAAVPVTMRWSFSLPLRVRSYGDRSSRRRGAAGVDECRSGGRSPGFVHSMLGTHCSTHRETPSTI